MNVTLIGCGCGDITGDARTAISEAGLLIGSKRLLDAYGEDKPQIEAVTAETIAAAIRKADCDTVCVLFSGDSGFHSGARLLLPLPEDCDTRVIPGVSSVQLFAARLQRPWRTATRWSLSAMADPSSSSPGESAAPPRSAGS